MKKLGKVFLLFLMLFTWQLNAAANGGKLTGRLQSSVNWPMGSVQSRPENNLKLGAEFGKHLHGVATIQGFEGLLKSGRTDTLEDVFKALRLAEIYLEMTGEDWSGGPAPSIRLGTLDIRYSPYLAYFQPWQGFSATSLPVGPFRLNGFYAWSVAEPVAGWRLALRPFLNTELSLNWAGWSGQSAVSFEGLTIPFQPLVVTWVVARNQSGVGPRKVDFAFSPWEKIIFRGGYRDFPTFDRFNPLYRDQRFNDLGEPVNPVDLYQGQQGLTGGCALKLGIFSVSLDYDHYNQTLGTANLLPDQAAGPNRSYRVGLEKVYSISWGSITGNYTGIYHRNDLFSRREIELGSGIRLNAPPFRGFEIGANLKNDSRPPAGQLPFQALGSLSFQSAGLITKYVYNFSTRKGTAWAGLQLKF